VADLEICTSYYYNQSYSKCVFPTFSSYIVSYFLVFVFLSAKKTIYMGNRFANFETLTEV
jgi:hypothetical protein